MARLILEVRDRHGRRFHKLEKPVTRIGRAYDNDIILQDPAVSPHHLVLRLSSEHELGVFPISDENGVFVDKRKIEDPLTDTGFPLALETGRTRLVIRQQSEPVAPTRLLSCGRGGTCLFGDWRWTLLLFGLLVCLTGIDNYLSTPMLLNWDSFWSDQALILATSIVLSAGLILINWVASRHWDANGAVAFVSMVVIVALLFKQATGFANYFFASALPGHLLDLVWHLAVLPLLLVWYFLRLNHGNATASVLLALAVASPGAYMQAQTSSHYFSWSDSFSKEAFYGKELQPWDIRIEPTLSVPDYIKHLKKDTP